MKRLDWFNRARCGADPDERKPVWFEYVCAEDNHHVFLGKENYFVNEDGYLMPTRKNQSAPDLTFFNREQK